MKDNETVQLQFSFIEGREITIPKLSETKNKSKGYVSYGDDNKFPQYLWDLYCRSSLLQSITNGIRDFVMGEGLINIDPAIKADKINDDGETLEDLMKKIELDYNVFGGFAMEILYNREHNISELYWIDMRKVRVDEYERTAYIDDDFGWGAKPLELPLYDKERIEASWKTDEPIYSCIYYYKGSISRGIYPVPIYSGALAALETSVEIQNFHLNNILNNLEASAVFNFTNGNPTEEEKKKLERQIKEKLGGTTNAGKFILLFSDDKEHSVEITRLEDDKMDEKFQTLQSSTTKEIFIAFRATPTLFGMSVENNGFSKEEFLQAFELYNKTMIKPIQKDLERVFNKIYGVESAFTFVPFSLGVVNNISEEDA